MRRVLLIATLVAIATLPATRSGGALATQIEPLTCNGKPPTILASSFDGAIFGTGGPDVIIVADIKLGDISSGGILAKATRIPSTVHAFGGNDTICVFYFDTIVYGGSGNDWISGGGCDNCVLSPPASKDWLKPAVMAGENQIFIGGLYGESGHDYVANGDLLYGATGNDTLENGEFCDGGAGTDTAINCFDSDNVENVVNLP
jgi:Ca2+-binding RTX toxin-like protein